MGSRQPGARVTLAPVLAALMLTGMVAVGQVAHAVCAPDVVEVRGAGGVARFTVSVADDAAERAQGLMNVPKLASGAGMLFIYDEPQRAGFWMKNTLIPLDMIFADAKGRVTRVHENAKPLDTTLIDGGPDVSFTLEINGGLARRMGIREGAVMRHPAMDQANAAWSCAD